MAPYWERWIIVDQNKISLNLMCFELLWNLDICLFQRQPLPCWPEFLVRAVLTTTTRALYYYSLEILSASDLVFLWDLAQDLE